MEPKERGKARNRTPNRQRSQRQKIIYIGYREQMGSGRFYQETLRMSGVEIPHQDEDRQANVAIVNCCDRNTELVDKGRGRGIQRSQRQTRARSMGRVTEESNSRARVPFCRFAGGQNNIENMNDNYGRYWNHRGRTIPPRFGRENARGRGTRGYFGRGSNIHSSAGDCAKLLIPRDFEYEVSRFISPPAPASTIKEEGPVNVNLPAANPTNFADSNGLQYTKPPIFCYPGPSGVHFEQLPGVALLKSNDGKSLASSQQQQHDDILYGLLPGFAYQGLSGLCYGLLPGCAFPGPTGVEYKLLPGFVFQGPNGLCFGDPAGFVFPKPDDYKNERAAVIQSLKGLRLSANAASGTAEGLGNSNRENAATTDSERLKKKRKNKRAAENRKRKRIENVNDCVVSRSPL